MSLKKALKVVFFCVAHVSAILPLTFSLYSVPIFKTIGDSKRLIGIVALDISLEWLSELVQSIKVLKAGYAVLISQNGTIVTHPDKRLIMNETLFTFAEERGDT